MINPTFALTRRAATLALVIAALVAAVLAALISSTPSTSNAADEAPSRLPLFAAPLSETELAAAQQKFAEGFQLLREAPPSSPEHSVVTDPGIDRLGAREIRVATQSALRSAKATTPDARLWVAPRDDGSQCLLAQPSDAQGPAEVCSMSGEAENGYLLMTLSRSSEDVEIYGLLPDGVKSVSIGFTDGTETTLPVVQNAYAAHFSRATSAISFVDANGISRKLAAGIDG